MRHVPAKVVCCVIGLLITAIFSPNIFADTEMNCDGNCTYQGKNLEALSMPIGGIGTGTIWLSGQGELSIWQIFLNNYTNFQLPDSFFAIRAKSEDGKPIVKILQEKPYKNLSPIDAITFRGNYPIGYLDFIDKDLPVKVSMKAYNPMIPLNTKDSAIPCGIFEITAENNTDKPVEVSAMAALQNPVGQNGICEVKDRKSFCYGGNQNVFSKKPEGSEIFLSVPSQQGSKFADKRLIWYIGQPVPKLSSFDNLTVKTLYKRGEKIPEADVVWVEKAAITDTNFVLNALSLTASTGGNIVLSMPNNKIINYLASLKNNFDDVTVFEDFEKSNYENWTVEGTAFGNQPGYGTEQRQMIVSGFIGRGLINSYKDGSDEPQGVLTSKPFIITKKYILFLIGGGNNPNLTCINLKINGETIKTQTGAGKETLEQESWDVSEHIGKQAVIEIVDKSAEGWGHVLVDQITFSDKVFDIIEHAISKYFTLDLKDAKVVSDTNTVVGVENRPWTYGKRLNVPGFSSENSGFKIIQSSKDGYPLIITSPFGKGTLSFVLADNFDLYWKLKTIAELTKTSFTFSDGIPPNTPEYGNMSLASLSTDATANTAWTDADALVADLIDDGKLSGPESSPVSLTGETVNAALTVPVKLAPGEKKTITFIISWFFPNFEKYGHKGMMYSSWYNSAAEVSADVRKRYDQLSKETNLYRDTMYETNLPCWFVDSITSQSCIFRGLTCFWVKDHAVTHKDYFAGYEGCEECCPLNCTHVWNYAQTHARLFPELGKNLREYDFFVYLKPTGETQHRQHTKSNAFIDGHCAVIEAAYREHLISPDNTFLDKIWPQVKKATDWLIIKIDKDEDGVNAGQQDNTYDCPTSGAHTFIGSQYLSALAAAEKMALIEGDTTSAKRYAKIRKAGTMNQDKLLWNGEYYIQIPDKKRPANDYNTGCHSDQLLGQWWSHMLDDGYLYPKDHIKQSLQSIMKYNFRYDFRGFKQTPRRYVIDDEGGLLMCTWPKGGRPKRFIIYADEIWTGIEYATAGLMMYEGMIDDALTIVRTVASRYDGVLKKNLNSGPGGNRFNELECGTFYARAMSNWGLLLAAQGFVYDGPKQRIGFRPNWKPEDHKSFFTAAEGWGLFTQKRDTNSQLEEIKVNYGKLPVKELEFVVSDNIKKVVAKVSVNGKNVSVKQVKEKNIIVLKLKEPVIVSANEVLKISFSW